MRSKYLRRFILFNLYFGLPLGLFTKHLTDENVPLDLAVRRKRLEGPLKLFFEFVGSNANSRVTSHVLHLHNDSFSITFKLMTQKSRMVRKYLLTQK